METALRRTVTRKATYPAGPFASPNGISEP
jgi:hypothetical protein